MKKQDLNIENVRFQFLRICGSRGIYPACENKANDLGPEGRLMVISLGSRTKSPILNMAALINLWYTEYDGNDF